MESVDVPSNRSKRARLWSEISLKLPLSRVEGLCCVAAAPLGSRGHSLWGEGKYLLGALSGLSIWSLVPKCRLYICKYIYVILHRSYRYYVYIYVNIYIYNIYIYMYVHRCVYVCIYICIYTDVASMGYKDFRVCRTEGRPTTTKLPAIPWFGSCRTEPLDTSFSRIASIRV